MLIRKEKIKFFEKVLADFFHKAGRESLPWRKQKITAYEVWVSEIMLQQTQVSRVILYHQRFLKRFPTVNDLAKVSWEEFLPYYEGLGYYARGRNMLKAAKMVVNEYRGQFPRDRKLLETLPGVGPYTAAAILSFAYGENHLAWDTNLRRVVGRFFLGGKQWIANELWWESKFVTQKKELNAALMDFGSALCTARPKCHACPLQSQCCYYKEGGKREQIALQKTRTQNVDWSQAVVHVFLHENHKRYFSAASKQYEPFILAAGYNTRAGIKKYFKERYGLTLSVRPPHQKRLLEGKPIMFVNAQILLGEPSFTVFSKNARKEYTERVM